MKNLTTPVPNYTHITSLTVQ